MLLSVNYSAGGAGARRLSHARTVSSSRERRASTRAKATWRERQIDASSVAGVIAAAIVAATAPALAEELDLAPAPAPAPAAADVSTSVAATAATSEAPVEAILAAAGAGVVALGNGTGSKRSRKDVSREAKKRGPKQPAGGAKLAAPKATKPVPASAWKSSSRTDAKRVTTNGKPVAPKPQAAVKIGPKAPKPVQVPKSKTAAPKKASAVTKPPPKKIRKAPKRAKTVVIVPSGAPRNAKPLGPKYKAPAAGARVKTKAKGPKPQRAMRSVSRGAKVNVQGPRATKPIRAPSAPKPVTTYKRKRIPRKAPTRPKPVRGKPNAAADSTLLGLTVIAGLAVLVSASAPSDVRKQRYGGNTAVARKASKPASAKKARPAVRKAVRKAPAKKAASKPIKTRSKTNAPVARRKAKGDSGSVLPLLGLTGAGGAAFFAFSMKKKDEKDEAKIAEEAKGNSVGKKAAPASSDNGSGAAAEDQEAPLL